MTETTTEHKIDRANWRPGPWDHEPDKLVWKTKAGLTGMLVRANHGALCGYVAVTKGHPWFGKSYNDEVGDKSIECVIDVHGGLTYASECAGHICHIPEPGEPDDVWWFGFDCAHSGDTCPGIDARSLRYVDFGGSRSWDSYRDLAYVQAEVESLALQLVGSPLATDTPNTKGTAT